MDFGVMLAQQIPAIVIAVRRSHDGVDMALGWLLVGEPHSAVVIELDHDDWALNSVIKGIFISGTSDPTPPGLVEPFLDRAQTRGQWPLR